MRLVLVRHATALASAADGDSGRALSEVGRAEAVAAGGWLVQRGIAPDLVLCSPARRARQTWSGMCEPMETDPAVRFDEELYLASSRDLAQCCSEVEAPIGTLLLVAHNPGITQFALALARGSDSEGHARLRMGFRPATIAVFDLAVNHWTEIDAASARLKMLWAPDSEFDGGGVR